MLDGQPIDPDVAPGEIRQHSVGVMRYLGAPAEDCEYLLERLCEWLRGRRAARNQRSGHRQQPGELAPEDVSDELRVFRLVDRDVLVDRSPPTADRYGEAATGALRGRDDRPGAD